MTELVLRRLIPVPREEVFAAWLDPSSLAQWMRPGDMKDAEVQVDPRITVIMQINKYSPINLWLYNPTRSLVTYSTD